MNDESVVFGLSQKTPEQRKTAYWLCGLGVAILWPLGTLLGAMVGKTVAGPGNHRAGRGISGHFAGLSGSGV